MGQLSSYSFVLLTIFYMQCKSQRPQGRIPGTFLVSRFERNPQRIIVEGGNVLVTMRFERDHDYSLTWSDVEAVLTVLMSK